MLPDQLSRAANLTVFTPAIQIAPMHSGQGSTVVKSPTACTSARELSRARSAFSSACASGPPLIWFMHIPGERQANLPGVEQPIPHVPSIQKANSKHWKQGT
jgi:hypothetical protein